MAGSNEFLLPAMHFFTDEKRASQQALFKKYLVQHQICCLLHEQVKDQRAKFIGVAPPFSRNGIY